MKALIVTPCHNPFGGVEEIVNGLARELSRFAWEVVLGLAAGERFNLPSRYEEAHPGLKTIEIDGRAGTEEARVNALVRTIRSVRPDLILSARIYDAYEAVARVKDEMPALRFAVTIQSYEADYLVDLEQWAPQVDLCVTSGNLIRCTVIERCEMEEERVISIPGGVKGEGFTRTSWQVDGPIRLGYAGRLDQEQKRVLDLVGIADELEKRGIDFTLSVVGAGPVADELSGALARFGGRAAVRDWIRDGCEYERFLRGLDVFLHCSEREGVSIAPREAMLNGAVPVISEFVGFWTEGHFRPGENCLSFPVGDCEAAARLVEYLCRNRDLLLRLSRNASASQCGIYSASGALEAWAKAFGSAMQMPAKRAFRPMVRRTESGRLARWGMPDSLAQSLRDLLRRRHVHRSVGSEWPHRGPFWTEDDELEFEEYALSCEKTAREVA